MTAQHRSPNHDARPPGRAIDMLLLHYTGMASTAEALARLCDPATKVSAHYLIDEDGAVHGLVDEGRRAWHAGVAHWRGGDDINGRAIGIELANPGHEFGYRPFPAVQLDKLCDLARDILVRHAIPRHRVLGHSDVAPGRKRDPGELFDWLRLWTQGIGFWPEADFTPQRSRRSLAPGASGAAVADLRAAFRAFGYGLAVTESYDGALEQVVVAFQRHWRQARVDGVCDGETQSILRHLLDRLPPAL